MKPSLKLSLLAIVGLCMSSCSEDNNLPVIHQDPSPIEKALLDFKSKISPGTRNLDAVNILSVETKYYTVNDKDSVVEASTTRGNEDILFDMNTVTIGTGDNIGFAILSTHPKINRVFYYTENGHVNDSALIMPLKLLIDQAPY